jgi:heavy metal translocating P-type ATPase
MSSGTLERTAPTTPEPPPVRRTRLFALGEVRWASAALVLFLVGLGLQLGGAPAWAWWAAYLVCYLTGGWEPALEGVKALRDKTLDVDLLMVVAALGAAAIGQITDGALLIVIFVTSGALEALATTRTQDSVRGLLDLAPQTATRVDDDGSERTVPAAELAVGEHVLARPGERIAADGVVVDGASEVDQATLTGEPLPVPVAGGDGVYAGTLNGTGALRIRVDRRAEDSVMARVAAMVEQATATKATTQLFIEKVEQRYSLGMVAATVALFAVPLLFGEALQDSLLRAMTFMIVASPCAVVLATMPPLLAAIANAGRHGVLAKSAVAMERLGSTTRVAFDKTGTLTRGLPEVAEVRALGGHDEAAVLRLAAAAEHPSEHPLGEAVVRAARERGLEIEAAAEFSAVPGSGVSARVGRGHVQVGSPDSLIGPGSPASAAVRQLQEQGRTAVVVLLDGEPAGVLGVVDELRAEAQRAVATSGRLTGSAPVLLTGDNATAAGRLAARVGITEVRAGLLPAQKVEVVEEMQRSGQWVAVVGDGVNDAPALATAETGIAMGGAGSDIALQAADAIVVRDDLSTVPAVVALSRRAHRVVVANLVIAAAFITGLVLWDLIGTLPLPLGVAGHEGSTILVALNGLRLLRRSAWARAGRAT